MPVQLQPRPGIERSLSGGAPRVHQEHAPGRIASLDGLRAISILMVVIGHAFATLGPLPSAAWAAPLIGVIGNGGHTGVSIFFVISGFLITTLLLKERERTGAISIRNFYIRRSFRIWPAFFCYVAVVAALSAAGALAVSRGELAAASLFVWNYVPSAQAWELSHTWSLSVEEQFYVAWPLCVSLLNRRRVAILATALIVALPIVRTITFVVVPTLEQKIMIRTMTHTRADMLMFGALLALLWGAPRFNALLARLFNWHAHTVAIVYLFLVRPNFDRNAFTLPFGYTLDGLAILLLLAYATRLPHSGLGRLLNSRPLVHIGLISYSLYLWQQLFSNPAGGALAVPFPFNIVCAVVAAEISYFAVEKTFLRLRQRLAPNS